MFALYVAGYCLGRFWIELLRSDEATLIADIRVNSFTSTFVFIGAVVYIMVAPKGREDPATLKGKPREEKSAVEEVAEELVAVAATTGVVAAAKVAGDDEDEDAKAAVSESEPEAADAEAETDEPRTPKLKPRARTPTPKPRTRKPRDADAEDEAAEAEELTADAEAEDEERRGG